MRCCIRATTRRSNQMLNSVSSTRITKISTALMHDEPPRVVAERASRLSTVGEQADRARRRSLVGSLHGDACCRARPRSASTPRPVGVGRHPDDVVGDVGDLGRQRDRAAVTGHGDAVGTERRRTTSALTRGDRRAGGGPQVLSSPSCIEPLSSSCFQVARASCPGRRRRRARAAATASRAARSPSQGPSSVHLGARPRRRCGSRADVPELLGDAGQDPQVGQRRRGW